MTDAHAVARDQLRAFIERIERLEEEKKTIPEDILRAAHKLGCDIRHHIAHSEIELIQHDVAVDLMLAKALHEAHLSGRAEGVRETDEARILGDRPSPWDEIDRSWKAGG